VKTAEKAIVLWGINWERGKQEKKEREKGWKNGEM